MRQNFLPSADLILAGPKGVLSRNPLFSSVFPPATVFQAHSVRKGGNQIPLLKGSKKGASQRQTVESTRRATGWPRKQNEKNYTWKSLPGEDSRGQADHEQEKQQQQREHKEEKRRRIKRRRSSRRKIRKASRNIKTEEAESQQRA